MRGCRHQCKATPIFRHLVVAPQEFGKSRERALICPENGHETVPDVLIPVTPARPIAWSGSCLPIVTGVDADSRPLPVRGA